MLGPLRSISEEKTEGLERASEDSSETVDFENIEFDPHLHGSLSDGIDPAILAVLEAKEIGLEGIAITDHHRDRLDDVLPYNDDAYRMVSISDEEGNVLSENMDILHDVLGEFSQESERRQRPTLEAFWNNAIQNGEDFDRSEVEEFKKESRKKDDVFDFRKGIERDYETWNDTATEQFLESEGEYFDHIVASTHYFPPELIEDNIHEDQTQYIRKADFSHLEDHDDLSIEDAYRQYKNETKTKLLRFADLTDMTEEEVEDLYDQYNVSADFDKFETDVGLQPEEVREPIAGDTPVIHAHWDLIMTNPYTRDLVTEEDIEEYLDLAEELDEIVEINGRSLVKQRKLNSNPDNSYAPNDAEYFARRVLERAEEGDLRFTIASDAHSVDEMEEHYRHLDRLLDEYEAEPLTPERLYG